MPDSKEAMIRINEHIANLSEQVKESHMRLAVTHLLLLAIARQIPDREKLRKDFKSVFEGGSNNLLFTDAADKDLAQLRKMARDLDIQIQRENG